MFSTSNAKFIMGSQYDVTYQKGTGAAKCEGMATMSVVHGNKLAFNFSACNEAGTPSKGMYVKLLQ